MRANFPLSFQAVLAATLVAGLSACSHNKIATDTDTASADATTDNVFINEGTESPDTTIAAAAASEHQIRHHSRGHSSRSTKAKVSEAPFQSESFWMNGAYFARGSESWESLSSLLYGRPDRATFLKKWNHNEALTAGTVVYYNSPSRPEDSQAMKLFSEDFAIALQSYDVMPGDSLSSIAKAHYGNFLSWKEIAALNPQLVNSDRILVGSKLNIQPTQVDTSNFLNSLVAQAQKEEPAAVATQGSVEDPVALSPKVASPPPVTQVKSKAIQINQTPKQKIMAMLSRIPDKALLALGLLVIVALGGVILKRRAGKESRDDNTIDSFTTNNPN